MKTSSKKKSARRKSVLPLRQRPVVWVLFGLMIVLASVGVLASSDQRQGGAGLDAVKVLAAGDLSCTDEDRPITVNDPNLCQDMQTAKVAERLNPERVLLLGDLQYEDGNGDQFQKSFAKSWGRFGAKLAPAVGNHEYRTSHAHGYFDYFNGLGVFTGQAGDRDKGYYSFDLRGWHIIALNSNCSQVGGCEEGSAQYSWLQSDLAAHPGQCTLAYWHHPVYTSGEFETAGDQRALGQPFFTLLVEHGADLVLNGHDHVYERFAHMDANGQVDPAGVRQITVGSGGRSHSPKSDRITGSEFFDNQDFGFLELNLGAGRYNWRFHDQTGRILDSGNDNCHSAVR